MRWKEYVLQISALIATICLFIAHEATARPDGQAGIRFVRGDGTDTVLIQSSKGKVILMDPHGSETTELLGKHLSIFQRRIYLLVLSHPDTEHLENLSDLLRRYTVHAVLLNGALSKNHLFDRFLKEIAEQKIRVLLPNPDHPLLLDDLTIETLWPINQKIVSTKGSSHGRMILRIHRGDRSILLAGAMRTTQAKEMLKHEIDLQADLLHITYNTVNEEFVRAVNPILGILPSPITPYSIPAKPFHALGIPLKSTAETGELFLKF
jgi:competence protein ComEC